MHKSIIYYTCNTHRPIIDESCRRQLAAAKGDCEIVSVSLNQPLAFGDVRLTMHGERGPLMMHRQILAGLEAASGAFAFLCESDVIYSKTHFDFTPPNDHTYCYNTHVWKVRYPDGLAVWTDDLQQVSGICASRALLLEFYRTRLAQIELVGFNRHYEPGLKQSVARAPVLNHQSAHPILCIRHDANLTKSKWSPSEYRNPQYAKGWTEAESVPNWGVTQGCFPDFLAALPRDV